MARTRIDIAAHRFKSLRLALGAALSAGHSPTASVGTVTRLLATVAQDNARGTAEAMIIDPRHPEYVPLEAYDPWVFENHGTRLLGVDGIGRPWDDVQSGDRVKGLRKRVAVNHMRFLPAKGITKYGTTEDQLDDLVALGADFARHLQSADLVWGRLFGSDSVPIPTSEATIRAAVFGRDNENAAALASVLQAAHSRGLKLALTSPIHAGGPRNVLGERPYEEFSGPSNWHNPMYFDFSGLYPTDSRDPARYWLDPFNADKVQLLAWVCKAAAELLVWAARDGAGLEVEDVVEHVEIINEANGRNVYYTGAGVSPALSGVAWGNVAFHCAKAFRDALDDAGVPRSVVLRLPSLASYHGSESDGKSIRTWSETLEFADALASTVAAKAESAGIEPSHVATGIDYHWYFIGDELTPRHIYHLVREARELELALRRALAVEEADVTVLETGVSVYQGSSYPDQPNQARELWRRLGGALASRATAVAWHSWMASSSDTEATWVGFGLREDVSDGTSPTEDAVARLSWGSFHLLAKHLRVKRGRMLHPTRLDAEPESGTALVVFEYLLDSSDYAYLVLVDPTDTGLLYRVRVRGTFVERDTITSVRHTFRGEDLLPLALPLESSRWVVSGTTYTMTSEAEPKLLIAPRPLGFLIEVWR